MWLRVTTLAMSIHMVLSIPMIFFGINNMYALSVIGIVAVMAYISTTYEGNPYLTIFPIVQTLHLLCSFSLLGTPMSVFEEVYLVSAFLIGMSSMMWMFGVVIERLAKHCGGTSGKKQ